MATQASDVRHMDDLPKLSSQAGDQQQTLLPSGAAREQATLLDKNREPMREMSRDEEAAPLASRGNNAESMRSLLTETLAKAPARSGYTMTPDPSSPSSLKMTEAETAGLQGWLSDPFACLSETKFSAYATSCASVSVFIYEGLVYNWVYLRRILPALRKEACVLPFAIMFNVAWLLAMWSYVVAHRADPGRVPDQWREFVRSVGDTLVVSPARLEWQPGRATLCRKCASPRPERAHHCHVCGICVLRMDHHCPWINNCVGFKNHKFFLLLVIYSSLSALVALVTSFPELVYIATNFSSAGSTAATYVPSGPYLPGGPEGAITTSDKVVFLIFGVLALFFLALLSPMLAAHLPLAAHNVTTIEGHYDNVHMPNPFDRGSATANMSQIFGKLGCDWLIPIAPLRPVSDGVSFPSTEERIGANGMPEAVLIGEELEFLEREALWRLRYHVRPPSNQRNDESSYGPLSTLTRWWSGDQPADVEAGGKPSARAGC